MKKNVMLYTFLQNFVKKTGNHEGLPVFANFANFGSKNLLLFE